MENDGQKVMTLGGPADVNGLLSRVELLLALAEGLGAQGAVELRGTSYREAVGRMLRWAATLRADASAGASAMVEDAQKERARVAAEIEVLRAERDVCMALAAEASSAVACHLTRWGAMDTASNSSLHDAAEASGDNGLRVGDAFSGRVTGGLASAEVRHGANAAADSITLAVSAVPDLATLMDAEVAVSRLPSVRSCSASSVRAGFASMDVALAYPVSPLMLASEIAASADCHLELDLVAEQHIAAHLRNGRAGVD